VPSKLQFRGVAAPARSKIVGMISIPDAVAFTGNQPKPNQLNLADDPKDSKKLAEMESLLLSEQKRLNGPYRLWNQPAE
jgi:hypothetical protein